MNTTDLISVIVPTYNAERYVREALDSVFAQTYKHIEVICINDGSKDATADILLSYGDQITFIDQQENKGIAASRNAGLRVARGAWVTLMDADDVWESEKLARQYAYVRGHRGTDIVFTYMQCFISPDLSPETRALRYCPKEPLPGILAASSFIRKACFDEIGFFDERWRVGEFIDWFARAQSAGVQYGVLEDVLLRRRIHDTNTGVEKRAERVDYVGIVRDALKRRNAS